jgi:hypothetical protein
MPALDLVMAARSFPWMAPHLIRGRSPWLMASLRIYGSMQQMIPDSRTLPAIAPSTQEQMTLFCFPPATRRFKMMYPILQILRTRGFSRLPLTVPAQILAATAPSTQARRMRLRIPLLRTLPFPRTSWRMLVFRTLGLWRIPLRCRSTVSRHVRLRAATMATHALSIH